MRKLTERQGVASQIIWAGQLKAPEMSWSFFKGLALVTTSRAAACPDTVLEALSPGCLSVSTAQAPMPEFFQDAVFYYQEVNAGTLAAQLAPVMRANDEKKPNERSGPQTLPFIRLARDGYFDNHTIGISIALEGTLV